MLIDGEKWACEACVRGHRVSNCQHHGELFSFFMLAAIFRRLQMRWQQRQGKHSAMAAVQLHRFGRRQPRGSGSRALAAAELRKHPRPQRTTSLKSWGAVLLPPALPACPSEPQPTACMQHTAPLQPLARGNTGGEQES